MDRLDTTKKVWVEPKLVVHGNVEKITMAPPPHSDKQYSSCDGLMMGLNCS
jgi:hypothetical protein